MRVYYMRHGEAAPHAASDALRPLTERGRMEVGKVAAWLASQPAKPAVCVASPYLRAQQTADIVLAALEAGLPRQQSDALTPDAPVPGVFALLESQQMAGCVLLVGHNPLAADFVQLAASGARGLAVSMPTAGIAVLEAEHWGLGTATLLTSVSPAQCR